MEGSCEAPAEQATETNMHRTIKLKLFVKSVLGVLKSDSFASMHAIV